MLHIPAHKNTADPPGQWINKNAKPVPEVREPEPEYKVDPPPEPPAE